MFKSSGEKSVILYEVALQILMMMRCDDELLLLLKIERKRERKEATILFYRIVGAGLPFTSRKEEYALEPKENT